MIHIAALTLTLAIAATAAPLAKQTLATGLKDPMEVAIAPDGNLFVVEREGRVLRIHPETGGIFEIGSLQVEARRDSAPKSPYAREDGLLGIALDPDFLNNQRLYLYYSAPDTSATRLSRFTLADGSLDPASEQRLLEIPTERKHNVCHQGGSLEFGPDGLLYLSTGDNTNPFESDGVAPIDDRDNRTEWDAQRSAGNSNDLRGKILRIKPTEDGYEIPPGNLFPPGTEKTRPEIYVMGCRNPFRISIDAKTHTLYWGEVGPDARNDSDKGPRGHDEVNQAKAAGNFGWPFVIADNKPYPIRDFATKEILSETAPAAPRNPGQRNTGLEILPPAQPALIYYPYNKSSEFPAMGEGGRNAMAGPVFYYDAGRKFNILPREDDRSLLTYEWMRGKIFKAKLNAEEELQSLEILMEKLVHPMDLEMDKDGSLVLLEYGSGWYFNKNGSVSRLLPDDGNKPPSITIKANPELPNTYQIDQASDPENDKITVFWYASEGVSERKLGSGSSVTLPAGSFKDIRAVARDEKGAFSVARIALDHSIDQPELTLDIGKSLQGATFGESVAFKITSKQPLDPKLVTVRARYIEPTGHDAGGPQFTTEISDLATSNQCLACHQVDSSSVGPSYLDVSLKYRNQENASAYLLEKLKAGSSGVWGDVPMPPQVALKPENAELLVSAILGLSQGFSEIKGTLDGTIRLSPQGSAETGGAWEIYAQAQGYSPAKIRIPAK